MSLEFCLRLAGVLQIALAAMHLLLPGRFNWKEELSRLSLLNRQIFVVHTVFICLVLVLMGVLSLFAAPLLLEPAPLARMVLGGMVVFWALRLAFQWCVFDWRLWRGNAFNTGIHILFTMLWTYFVAVYLAALLRLGGQS